MANEKRLIDANALKEQIENEIHTYWTNGTGGYCLAEDVIPDIDNAPTVDAVEVVHAQWDNNGICTLCGYPIPTDSKHDFIDGDDCLFCYHCGAKMDGGNEDGC